MRDYKNMVINETLTLKMIKMYYAVKPITNEKVFFHARDLMGARQFALTLGFIPTKVSEA